MFRWRTLIHDLSWQYLKSHETSQVQLERLGGRCIDVRLDCYPFRHSQSAVREVRAKEVRTGGDIEMVYSESCYRMRTSTRPVPSPTPSQANPLLVGA